MKEYNSKNLDRDISEINRFITDELLKIENSSAIIEDLKKLPENLDRNNMIKMIVDLKLHQYEGDNSQKNEVKKKLFKFADKIKINELLELGNYFECNKLLENLVKNKYTVLCSFLAGLLSVKAIQMRQRRSKQESIYDLSPVKLSFNIDDVIQSIREMCKFHSEVITVPNGVFKLQDLSNDEIVKRIENILNKKDMKSLINELPLFSHENIIFDEKGRSFLGKKTQSLNIRHPHLEFRKVLRIAEIIRELIINNRYTCIEKIYRKEKELFEDKESIKRPIKDLASIIGTYYDNLHIYDSIAGNIKGHLIFRDEDREWELSRIKRSTIPIEEMNVEVVDSNAVAIIVIGNAAEMIRLSFTDFWKKFPCILISYIRPNHYTRYLIKKITSKIKIPVFGIFELSLRGIKNLLTLVYGDTETALETPKLALNNFYWLGLMPNDIKEYDLNMDTIEEMTEEDIKGMNLLLKREPFLRNNELANVIRLLLDKKEKIRLSKIVDTMDDYDKFPNYILSKIYKGDFFKL